MVNALIPATGKPELIGHAAAKSWLAAVLLGIMLLFAAQTRAGEDSPIAVVYPEIGEPYREVFEKIIEGIEAKIGTQVAAHPVRSDADNNTLKASLSHQNIKIVIALGRQGMKTAAALNNNMGLVVGGVLTVPESEVRGRTVISLTPDPALLFSRMKMILPSAKRVFVVYDPSLNSWLLKVAKEAARVQGLELVVFVF